MRSIQSFGFREAAFIIESETVFIYSLYCPEFFTTRGRANLQTLAAPETRAKGRETGKPFVTVDHSTAEDEEAGVFHDADEVPWTIHFRAHSLRPANFYYFMFREFWEIVRYRNLNAFSEIEKLLKDPISLIDDHFAWLKQLGPIGKQNYEARIAARQRELYGRRAAR